MVWLVLLSSQVVFLPWGRLVRTAGQQEASRFSRNPVESVLRCWLLSVFAAEIGVDIKTTWTSSRYTGRTGGDVFVCFLLSRLRNLSSVSWRFLSDFFGFNEKAAERKQIGKTYVWKRNREEKLLSPSLCEYPEIKWTKRVLGSSCLSVYPSICGSH